MLTFIEERRRRIMKAREEGRAEGRAEGYEEGWAERYEEGLAEGRAKGRKEIVEVLSRNPRIAALFREDPKVRATLQELGIDPPERENGGG